MDDTRYFSRPETLLFPHRDHFLKNFVTTLFGKALDVAR
jgi:hypothetical protein